MKTIKNHKFSTILHYLKNKLSNKERYAIEKEAQNDPFLQEALDGFSQIKPEDIEADLRQLQLQLSKKESQVHSIIPFIRVAASIAIFILMGTSTWYFISHKLKNNELAYQQSEPKQDQNTMHENLNSKKSPRFETESEKHEFKTITDKNSNKSKQNDASNKNEKMDTEKIIVADNEYETEQPTLNKSTYNEPEILKPEDLPQAIPKTRNNYQSGMGLKPVLNTQNDSQLQLIKGRVLNEIDLTPISGAIVRSNDTNHEVLTNIDGTFEIVADSNATIDIAFVGMKTKTHTITGNESQDNEIILTPLVLAMEELTTSFEESKETQQQFRLQSSANNSKKIIENAARKLNNPTEILTINYTTDVDVHANPVGGQKALEHHLKAYFSAKQSGKLRFEINVTVDNFGQLNNFICIYTPPDFTCNELIELIKKGPKWHVAKLDELPVSEEINLLFLFEP